MPELPQWRAVALKRMFRIMDNDGDGFISHEELGEAAKLVVPQNQYSSAAWTPQQTARAVLFLGGGADGRVSLEAFLKFYGNVMGQVKDDDFEVCARAHTCPLPRSDKLKLQTLFPFER